ncbi:MAG: PD-(D/E)XK nuclease family protein [Endomicrobia bacterium]|nr:PD-(D/E)XK nuclease family protein [Endomicrobiia bacterium]MCL2506114.1 PD-(D/E)XK nuclease family protein [Endomicrobiia bacterium]
MNEIKKFSYTDILGWSVSRFDKFSNCKRQYFYDYYSKYDKSVPFEKIQFLKSLTSKALEAGNIVHDIIRDMLFRFQKSSKPISRDKFFKYSFDLTEKYCGEKTFFETYYNGEAVASSEIYAKVKTVLENFINSGRFSWIETNAVPTSNEWVIEPAGFGETRINGFKAFCKVDFLFPVGDKIYILDWKTGKPDEIKHSKQLTGYSLWASYHFGKEAKDIMPMIVYLFPQYSEKSVVVDNKSIASFSKQVEEETKQMYEYLTDVEKNIPKDKGEFPCTSNTFFCKYCNYREICKGF